MSSTVQPLSVTMEDALLGSLIEGESLNEPPALRWLRNAGSRPAPPQTKAALIGRDRAVADGADAPPLTVKGVAEAERIRAVRRADAALHQSDPVDATPLQAYVITCPRCVEASRHRPPVLRPGLTPAPVEDAAAVRATRALDTAGLDLADLSQGYDPKTCTATGYVVAPRGTDADEHAWVYVYYLTDGKTHDPVTGQHSHAKLYAAGAVLCGDGWG